MLVLFEAAAGIAVFKVLDENKIKEVDTLRDYFATAKSASKVVQLAEFHKFHDSAEALQAAVHVTEGTVGKPLKSLLKKFKNELDQKLLVVDAKLGASIREKFAKMEIVCNSNVSELIRCISDQRDSLLPGISEKETTAMSLGLGHNLARYKLKFSPDKVDTMVIQAINLLDDLDKEINNYTMRAKEWYGWHFPELAKILTQNNHYILVIKKMGFRTNAKSTDFSDILTEELETRVKEAAEVSMGCEISDMDIEFMQGLCEQIIEFSDYRQHLDQYLCNRMECLAPNLTIMVGEAIGARLIAHTGSLLNLAKNPASTIQLIGAEKALFRALKTKAATPKYGLIYHAELVAKAPTNCKGKMSRMLAAKAALASRVDAIAEVTSTTFSEKNLCYLRKRGEIMKEGKSHKISGQSKHFDNKPHFSDRKGADAFYQTGQDSTFEAVKRERVGEDDEDAPPRKKKKKTHAAAVSEVEETPNTVEKKKKKKKKKEKEASGADNTHEKSIAPLDTTQEEDQPEVGLKKKKKKKKDKVKEEEGC